MIIEECVLCNQRETHEPSSRPFGKSGEWGYYCSKCVDKILFAFWMNLTVVGRPKC